MLAEMELPASAPLIDFGDILLPTLYSSTGKRQSMSLENPLKAQSFRDPALDFLDIRVANEGDIEGILLLAFVLVWFVDYSGKLERNWLSNLVFYSLLSVCLYFYFAIYAVPLRLMLPQ